MSDPTTGGDRTNGYRSNSVNSPPADSAHFHVVSHASMIYDSSWSQSQTPDAMDFFLVDDPTALYPNFLCYELALTSHSASLPVSPLDGDELLKQLECRPLPRWPSMGISAPTSSPGSLPLPPPPPPPERSPTPVPSVSVSGYDYGGSLPASSGCVSAPPNGPRPQPQRGTPRLMPLQRATVFGAGANSPAPAGYLRPSRPPSGSPPFWTADAGYVWDSARPVSVSPAALTLAFSPTSGAQPRSLVVAPLERTCDDAAIVEPSLLAGTHAPRSLDEDSASPARPVPPPQRGSIVIARRLDALPPRVPPRPPPPHQQQEEQPIPPLPPLPTGNTPLDSLASDDAALNREALSILGIVTDLEVDLVPSAAIADLPDSRPLSATRVYPVNRSPAAHVVTIAGRTVPPQDRQVIFRTQRGASGSPNYRYTTTAETEGAGATYPASRVPHSPPRRKKNRRPPNLDEHMDSPVPMVEATGAYTPLVPPMYKVEAILLNSSYGRSRMSGESSSYSQGQTDARTVESTHLPTPLSMTIPGNTNCSMSDPPTVVVKAVSPSHSHWQQQSHLPPIFSNGDWLRAANASPPSELNTPPGGVNTTAAPSMTHSTHMAEEDSSRDSTPVILHPPSRCSYPAIIAEAVARGEITPAAATRVFRARELAVRRDGDRSDEDVFIVDISARAPPSERTWPPAAAPTRDATTSPIRPDGVEDQGAIVSEEAARAGTRVGSFPLLFAQLRPTVDSPVSLLQSRFASAPLRHRPPPSLPPPPPSASADAESESTSSGASRKPRPITGSPARVRRMQAVQPFAGRGPTPPAEDLHGTWPSLESSELSIPFLRSSMTDSGRFTPTTDEAMQMQLMEI